MRKIKSSYIILPNLPQPLENAIIHWEDGKIYDIEAYEGSFMEQQGVEYYSGILVSSIVAKYKLLLQDSDNIINAIFEIYKIHKDFSELAIIIGLDWENMKWINKVSKIKTIK